MYLNFFCEIEVDMSNSMTLATIFLHSQKLDFSVQSQCFDLTFTYVTKEFSREKLLNSKSWISSVK